jgi:putative ABC transport system permease protein
MTHLGYDTTGGEKGVVFGMTAKGSLVAYTPATPTRFLEYCPSVMPMLTTPWIKVLVDLWQHRGRTLVVALAIAVGVYAVGVLVNVREIIVREYHRDQAAAQMASAIVYTAPFGEDLADSLAKLPLVTAAEGRATVSGRVYRSVGTPQDLTLIVVPDFSRMHVDSIVPMQGQYPPGDREVVLERLSVDPLETGIGRDLRVELSNDAMRTLHVVGTVHDAQEFSPALSGQAVGYITLSTMQYLGYGDSLSELHLRVTEPARAKDHILAAVDQVSEQLKRSDRTVASQQIITRSRADAYINSVILILTGFGVVILLLSSFLVVNAISALITQQIPQIGVMKLIGARQWQIIVLYLATVLVYGVIAVAIALPLAALSARLLMTQLVEKLLNVMPASYAIPVPMLLAQAAVGLLLPVAAGLMPVIRGTGITTHQALNETGLANKGHRASLVDRLLTALQRAHALQRPLLLAIRNTLRHKGRLAQTLVVLIFGTALFISVLSVRSSVGVTLASFMRFHQYDVSVQMQSSQLATRLQAAAAEVPGVTAVEVWASGRARRVRPDDSKSDPFSLVAVPVKTTFMNPEILSGRWLPLGGTTNALVVNSDFIDNEKDTGVGSQVVLEIGDRKSTWDIVGVVSTESRGAAVYVNLADYAYATRTPGEGTRVLVQSSRHDQNSQRDLAARLWDHLDALGLKVSGTQTAQVTQQENQLLFNVVVSFLILMALLLAAVGGLGLATTMSINMMERVREIGVLRAIGAANAAVGQIVLAEGCAIAVVSWVGGTILSVFLSPVFSEQLGLALIKIPLRYQYSVTAAGIWFFILLAIAIVASLGPARDAVRLTIREVLAYE